MAKKSRNDTALERLAYLQKEVAALESQNRALRMQLGKQEVLIERLSEALEAAPPYPKAYKLRPIKHAKPVWPVMLWSDWHIGEVVEEDETEGFGKYCYDIAQDRLYDIVDRFLRWIQVQRKIHKIEHCAVFVLGDLISGDIHEELRRYNEFPLPVQAAKAGYLMSEAVRRLASHFKSVHLWCVGGDNHSRLVPKPQAKKRFENSMQYLVQSVATTALAKHQNVIFHEAKSAKTIASVNEWNFLLMHGDQVKSYLGLPFYGLVRERDREARKRMRASDMIKYDYIVLGHFHVPSIIEDQILINGALCGTTELDHICGRFAAPAQVAFMVHPEHGLFGWTPFRCNGFHSVAKQPK